MGIELAAIIAAADPPAGGAEISQVIIATAGAAIATAVLLWIITAHRSGRIAWVGNVAGFAERQLGLPGWAALPSGFIGGSLLIAVFGMYWDISLHIDQGRDAGPLANPAHYFILVGLFGVFFCGIISIALAKEKPSDTAIRLAKGWWAPVGALMILVCGTLSLLAFPLDDVWHRIFGQDVTLWGPTHLLLFGGASFSILGIWVLQVEGRRSLPAGAPKGTWLRKLNDVGFAGALLIGMSTFQAEFDFGVPQFRLVWHPVMLAIAAGIALVAARIRLGRGGALATVAFFIAIRGLLTLLVGPTLGETLPHFPLYIVEALLVEAVALRWGARRPFTLGAVAGALIGSVGFFAEYAWSHAWMVNPWPPELIGQALPLALVAGIGAGVLGGAIGRAVTPDLEREERPRGWVLPVAGAAVIGVCLFTAPETTPSNPPKATFALDRTESRERAAIVTVQLDPKNAADDALWLNVTAWQGGDKVVNHLKRIGPGRYRATEPLPLHGEWKSTLRLHRGREVIGIPIYMPEDKAIPVKATPLPTQAPRTFIDDKQLLQREVKDDVSPALATIGYAVVALIAAIVAALLVAGLRRIRKSGQGQGPPRAQSGSGRPRRSLRAPVPAGR